MTDRLKSAMQCLETGACWVTTKDWRADDFRQHIRAELNRQQAAAALRQSPSGYERSECTKKEHDNEG